MDAASSAVGEMPPDMKGFNAILAGDHGDPFSFLGVHTDDGDVVVRAFHPEAQRIDVIDAATGKQAARMRRVKSPGCFAATIKDRDAAFPYRLKMTFVDAALETEDPYRFPPVLRPGTKISQTPQPG